MLSPDDSISAYPVAACGDTFLLSGRIAIRYQRNGKEENLHGQFRWTQSSGRIRIDLGTPMGTTLASLSVDPTRATLVIPQRKQIDTADTAEQLTRQKLGWTLPASSMQYWLQGCATDDNGSAFLATPRQNEVTTAQGWHIHYADWMRVDETRIRPRRIDIAYLPPESQEAEAEIHIHIIADTWQD
jgi:outer membrane lipoprotein LolB